MVNLVNATKLDRGPDSLQFILENRQYLLVVVVAAA